MKLESVVGDQRHFYYEHEANWRLNIGERWSLMEISSWGEVWGVQGEISPLLLPVPISASNPDGEWERAEILPTERRQPVHTVTASLFEDGGEQ